MSDDDDPYLWLEDVEGSDPRAWVAAQTAETEVALCGEAFARDRRRIFDILDAPDRIRWVAQRRRFIYNLWRDAHNPKGLWRRTTVMRWRRGTPEWDTVVDVDALARTESED